MAKSNVRSKVGPLCQIEVAVPESGTMETLPDCFFLKNLLDILAIKECSTSKVTCGNCDEKSEEASYCFHCGKFWCRDCLNAHNVLKENTEHRVLGLREFYCKEVYCQVCEIPDCQTCVTLGHSKHDVEHLKITARAVKNSITTKLDTIKKSSKVISNYIRELEEQSRLTERRSQIVKGQIQQTVKSLIFTPALQHQERKLITEVENQTKEIQEELMNDKVKFQEQLKKSEETISKVNRFLERSTGAELVRTKSVNEILRELHETQDMPPTLERKIPNTVFLKNQKLSEILEESKLGRLDESATDANQCLVEGFQEATAGLETQFEVITRNSEGEQYHCPGDYIAVEIMSAQGGKVASEMKIIDKNDGSYAVSFIPSKAGQCKVSVQINGEKLREFPQVYIKERSFKPLRIIGDGRIDGKELVCPWGVAVNNSNEIFVSDRDNDRILVFNENGEFIRSFGKGLVDEPTGVSVGNDGRTFVVNRGNNKIILFHAYGGYVTTVNNAGSLKEPRGISLDSQGNIVVCDSGNKCIRIFSPEGNIFKTIGAGWLHMPFDCLCHEDKIFVSDRDAHVIKVYNNTGRFLYKFGKHGTEDGELNHPAGLAVDKAGHLLVCSLANCRVQVFTLDGKFVTKFGGVCGEELGHIRRPSSISVLKSGHIVICEFGNHRLQLFA